MLAKWLVHYNHAYLVFIHFIGQYLAALQRQKTLFLAIPHQLAVGLFIGNLFIG